MKEIKTREGLDAALTEAARQKAIRKKIIRAYAALYPCLGSLSSGSEEWQDAPGFHEERKEALWKKNEFVVEGDNDATYKKALQYLLQQEGSSVHFVAEVLLGKNVYEPGGRVALGLLENHLLGILGDKK